MLRGRAGGGQTDFGQGGPTDKLLGAQQQPHRPPPPGAGGAAACRHRLGPEAGALQQRYQLLGAGEGSQGHQYGEGLPHQGGRQIPAGAMGEGPQQPLQVVQGFWRPTTRQQQQPPLAVQPGGARGEGAESIHHRVARGGGPHPVAPQAPGRECIAHGHQAATGPAHQGPFPGIPFAALAVVVGVSQGAGRPTGRWRRAPGVITFWRADKAIGAASGPGQQQGQQVADRQHGLPSPAPAAHQAPLAPAQLGQAGA